MQVALGKECGKDTARNHGALPVGCSSIRANANQVPDRAFDAVLPTGLSAVPCLPSVKLNAVSSYYSIEKNDM